MTGRHLILVATAFIGAVMVPSTLAGQAKPGTGRAPADEFFIISSVDLGKNQLLLKRPTEVTEVMRVNESTRYLDENGRPLKLSDLRAGDTVYISSKPSTGGAVALQIHRGPMTLTELRRRYLQ